MFKRKRLWIIPIIVALVAVTGVFAAPGLVPGANEGSVVLAEGPDSSVTIDKPVKPSQPPPLLPGVAKETVVENEKPEAASEGSKGGRPGHIWYENRLWRAYKDGDDAVGKARTRCGCAGCYYSINYNVTTYLWNAQPGEDWQLVASKYHGAYCPFMCTLTVYAEYNNAETAWYCTTSRHRGYYEMQPVWDETLDTSDDPQWLEFD